jgi:uncharacterized membrane protein YozB (DUF420 family)
VTSAVERAAGAMLLEHSRSLARRGWVGRTLIAVTTLLALLGVALSIEHVVSDDHYNPGFLAFPVLTRLHVMLGAVYLALALLQVLPAIRARRPGLHRRIGRVAASGGIVAGGTSLAMMSLFPFAGTATLVVAGPFACWFSFAVVRGILLARRGRYEQHREWMIRAFAIGTGIATMRLIFVPLLFGFGEATDERARPLSVISFGVAFALHAAVAEVWIRATRRATSAEAARRPSPPAGVQAGR